ncbi:MAG TPA: NTP transferase domain-containing protein, partial [Bacteroidota bacterium]|nr:NTP transferase domain-containing protein [Bacteroidota bacterium]
MVSAIIVANTTHSVSKSQVPRVVEALKLSRVLNCVALVPEHEQAWQQAFSPYQTKLIKVADPATTRAISAGIAACDQKDLHGVIIVPLDAAATTQGVVAAALHQFWTSHQPVVVAQMTDGSRITIISNRLFEEIHRAGEAAMLSEILLTHSSDTRSVRFDQA